MQPGEIFNKRYKIIQALGSGAMGDVYLANDILLNDSEVALKFLNTDIVNDSKQVQRFLQEVLLTRKISSPHVVATYDAGKVDGQLFFAMEYVDGKNFNELIRSDTYSITDKIKYLQELIAGVKAIHQADIIHRDLKPANVMISSSDVVKIADFGVAKQDNLDITAADEIIGSSYYMSPEAWKGEKLTPSSDVYSLGIIAYQLFTGTLPYQGQTSAQVMYKHLEGKAPEPQELKPEIPLWLNNLILDMIEPYTETRPNLDEVQNRFNKQQEQERVSRPQHLEKETKAMLDKIEQSDIWDPASTIKFEKKLINPDFGTENLRKVEQSKRFSEKLRKFLKESNLTKNKLFLPASISIAAVLLLYIFDFISPYLKDFLIDKYNNSGNRYLWLNLTYLVKIVFYPLVLTIPILIVISFFDNLKNALSYFYRFTIFNLVLLLITSFGLAIKLSYNLKNSWDFSYKIFSSYLHTTFSTALDFATSIFLLSPVTDSYVIIKANNLPSIIAAGWVANFHQILFAAVFIAYLWIIIFCLKKYYPINKKIKREYLLALVMLFVLLTELAVFYVLRINDLEIAKLASNSFFLDTIRKSPITYLFSCFNYLVISLVCYYLLKVAEKRNG